MMEQRWKTRLRRGILGVLAAWLALVAWGWWFAWRKLPTLAADESITLAAPIMDGAGYTAVINTHPRPKIVRIEGVGRGALLLYGAEHVRDPDHPQIADIAARWAEFRPTVALCESRLGILFPGLMDPIKTFGEPGAVKALARRDGVPTYTWEPPVDSYMRCLLAQSYSKEQVALRVILGPYFSNRRHGRPEDPEAFVLDTLGERSRWPGVEGAVSTIDGINAAWNRYFPEGPDWRDVSDQYGLPGFLRDLDINGCRQEHFARLIIDLVRRGERVFAVAGSSHAVRLEGALETTFVSMRHGHHPE